MLVNKSNRINQASNLIIIVLGVMIIFPPLRALPFFDILWLILMLAWYFFNLTKYPSFFLKSRLNFSILFFFFCTISSSYLFENFRIGNRYLELSLIFIFFFAYKLNKYLNLSRANISILKWLMPFTLVTSILTLYAYQINPYISRSIKRSSETAVDAMNSGVGGYDFIYFLVIICPILLSLLLVDRRIIKIKYKILIFFFFLLISANIVLSNFSTALLLLIICIPLIMLINKIKSIRTLLVFLLTFITIIFWDGLLTNFFDFLSTSFGENMNASRMNELSQYSSSSVQGNSIQERILMYNKSITTFMDYPIFGAIHNDLNLTGKSVFGFGQHSTILDCFALFGFFIGLIQIYVFTKPFSKTLKSKIFLLKKLSYTVLIQLMILGLFNNITPIIGLAAFFIFPTIYDWISEQIKT